MKHTHASSGFAAWLFALAVALSACTPALDWRQVANPDSGYSALFPSKPAMISRDFVIAGETVPLRLQAATVNGVYFAVGEIPLTPAQRLKADDMVHALQQSMHHNIGADKVDRRELTWGGAQWTEIRADGRLPKGQAAVLAGRFLVQPHRILEVIVMGERANLSDDVIDQWFGGFSLGVKG